MLLNPNHQIQNVRGRIPGSIRLRIRSIRPSARTHSHAEPEQYLLTGISTYDGFNLIVDIQSIDSDLSSLEALPIEGTVIACESTGRDGDVLVTTLAGSTIVDAANRME